MIFNAAISLRNTELCLSNVIRTVSYDRVYNADAVSARQNRRMEIAYKEAHTIFSKET